MPELQPGSTKPQDCILASPVKQPYETLQEELLALKKLVSTLEGRIKKLEGK